MYPLHPLTALTAVLALAASAGCGQQTPAQTDAKVARAESSALADVSDAKKEAGDRMAGAYKDLRATQADVGHTRAESVHAVTLAEANAAHEVATARCGSLVGEEKTACTTRADADLATSKANAGAARAATDPTP